MNIRHSDQESFGKAGIKTKQNKTKQQQQQKQNIDDYNTPLGNFMM